MTQVPFAADCIDSTIPIFLVAAVKETTLNAFFAATNAACENCEYDEPQGTVMHTSDVPSIHRRTKGPIDPALLQEMPLLGCDTTQIISFAHDHLHLSNISPTNMIILDERSNKDLTCLLLSHNQLSNDPWDFVQVRSDFESSIISLKTIETGCGGADQLDTDYEDSDGILRISVRDK